MDVLSSPLLAAAPAKRRLCAPVRDASKLLHPHVVEEGAPLKDGIMPAKDVDDYFLPADDELDSYLEARCTLGSVALRRGSARTQQIMLTTGRWGPLREQSFVALASCRSICFTFGAGLAGTEGHRGRSSPVSVGGCDGVEAAAAHTRVVHAPAAREGAAAIRLGADLFTEAVSCTGCSSVPAICVPQIHMRGWAPHKVLIPEI